MGTLGQYLRSAREARGIDLRDAAQQTRIGMAYLKALEEEDFSRLPGEVFVKGFLKNYGKFLRLDESEVVKKYEALKPQRTASGNVTDKEPAAENSEQKPPQRSVIEPALWGTGIVIALILFLWTALPEQQPKDAHQPVEPVASGQTVSAPTPSVLPVKLYLEVAALEDTWVLVRIDTSPQKQQLLKKGESLIWSADERFLLSYGSAGALKLMLNGQELTVTEPKNAVVRDLVVTAAGLEINKVQAEQARLAKPKRKPATTAPQPPPAAAPARTQQLQPEAAPVPPPRSPEPESQELQGGAEQVPSPLPPASTGQPAQPSPQTQ